MSKLKHTPGPWKIRCYTNTNTLYVSPESGRIVFEANESDEEGVANTHLIAAAPELLEALKRLIREDDGGNGELTVGLFEDAAAAIAKATGEK